MSRFGYLDEAYALLNRETFPSWLYPVKRGATTIWERWDGLKPDGSFEDAAMNSFNHYAYGAVGEWMYTVIGGINIDPDEPGYKHILIHPQPGGGLSRAAASHATPYGKVTSRWQLARGQLELAVVIPPNTTATIVLPGTQGRPVSEGGKPLREDAFIHNIRREDDETAIEVRSGQYLFRYPYQSHN